MDKAEVTQADREAAAEMYRFVQSRNKFPHSPELIARTVEEINSQRWDKDEAVQAFARHRHTTETTLREAAVKAAEELENARIQFAYYAELHACKGTAEGDAKAKTNLDMANRMSTVLDELRKALENQDAN
jgi:hypothetical protein